MKVKEKEQARRLRKQGWSINQIYKKLGVGKGSVSVWVRDIELTGVQRRELSERGHSKDVIEKRRKTRLDNEYTRRRSIIDAAKSQVNSISRRELFLIGTALYWAEGKKRSNGMVSVSNGDPELIMVTMRFLREVCQVPEDKLKGYIHIHPHLSVERALQYWSHVAGIPQNQFYKTYNKPNIASQGKKDTLPYGTFSVNVCDTKLLLTIKGWMEGIVGQLGCEFGEAD